jgi:hypothetical protein
MAALVAGIQVLSSTISKQDVDGRDKPGHDRKPMTENTYPACRALA